MLRQTGRPRSATDHPDASADGQSKPGIRRLHPSTTLARLHASATGLVPVSEVAHDANKKGTVSYWHLWTSCSASVGPAGKETRSPRSRGPPGTGIPGFGLRILANGIQQPPRRLQDPRPCRPPGRQDTRTHAPAGTASPRARLSCQPASAALTDETPPQTSDLLRQNTRQGWRPNGTDYPKTRNLRNARQGLPGQDRQESPRNRLRAKPLDGTSTPLPWERCSSGSGRRSGRHEPEASAAGDGMKAGDREQAEDHAPGSPGKPASVGLNGSELTRVAPGCSRVRRVLRHIGTATSNDRRKTKANPR